jgi:hypothetical protein
MGTRRPTATTVVSMKAMVLLAREGRRLRRAAVVGGLGPATGQSPRLAGPGGEHEHQPDTSRDEFDEGKREIRHG